MAGAPRKPDSLLSRVRTFFVDNPDEELTRADMLVKFDTTKPRIDQVIFTLRHTGYLAVVQRPGEAKTYRLADDELDEAYEELTEWRDQWLATRGLAPSPQA